jgi:hypothetical protein
MKLLRRLKAWWQGSRDPVALGEAERARQEMETQKTGALTGPANITHRGKDSTSGFRTRVSGAEDFQLVAVGVPAVERDSALTFVDLTGPDLLCGEPRREAPQA